MLGPSYLVLLEADPLLPTDQSGLVAPVWNEVSHSFPSGSTTIREEFERLVMTYGALGTGSQAIGAADLANMPAEDILGRARDGEPDLGAFEYAAVVTGDTVRGWSERLFVKTPRGWKIAVTGMMQR